MSFRPIKTPPLAEAVVAEFEALLLAGVLRPGEKLPPERELAEQLQISRGTLREAMESLAERGLIEKRKGSGAVVSETIAASIADPLSALIASQRAALDDYVAFRRLIEGDAAAKAAERATAADREAIARLLDALRAAQKGADRALEARLDVDFHMAIVEAAGNVVTIQVMRALSRALRRGMTTTRQAIYDARDVSGALLAQHAAIAEAILGRSPEAARAASDLHLDFVLGALRDADAAARRTAIAERRRDRPDPS